MLGLAGLLLLGVGAQWLAWRLRLPSILLLLLVGFVIGPFTGHRLLDPDELLGESLLPFVSLSVAVVLFEGGLSLRLRELRGAGRTVFQLSFFGPPITFALATLAGRVTLGLDWELCALLGATMVVTGPTVILPLIRHVRPAGTLGRVILWEGIVTDPIGAIFAVLVFQGLLHGGDLQELALHGAGMALLGGGLAGFIGAALIVLFLLRDLVPDYLHASAALGIALAAYVAANLVQHEAGLLAVTLMGILLANQRWVSIEHIVEFKENLRVILLSTLFLLLAARLPLEEFTRFDLGGLGYLLLLVLIVRPVSVLASTLFTSLTWKERLFVSWMAPRGVVAAAVTSIFALELTGAGRPGADRLVPVVFLVILGTVAIYGLTSLPVAKRLGLARPAPQGVLLVGAHEWSRTIGTALKQAGVEVLLVDTNHHEVLAAHMDGLAAYHGSVLSEEFLHSAPLENLGHVIAVTPNEHVNALACLHLAPVFGRSNVHMLVPSESRDKERMPRHLRGRVLFDRNADFWALERRFRAGAIVKRTRLSEEYRYDDFCEQYEAEDAPVVPLFVKTASSRVRPVTARDGLEIEPGDTLLALVDPPPASYEERPAKDAG